MIKYIGKSIRIEKGYTVRGLASASCISPSTISKWENGSALPDFSVLDLVAKTLKICPWQLIEYIDEVGCIWRITEAKKEKKI